MTELIVVTIKSAVLTSRIFTVLAIIIYSGVFIMTMIIWKVI